MSNNKVVTEAELSKFTYPCSECGKPESNANTVANQWLYVMEHDAYLCQSCHQKPKHDDWRQWYLPFYITSSGSPDVKWTEEWA